MHERVVEAYENARNYLDIAKELWLLASDKARVDAIDGEGDVVIGYRDRHGERTVRRIRPEQLLDGWLRTEFRLALTSLISPNTSASLSTQTTSAS